MTNTAHMPAPSGAPLCGRVLSRNTPLTQRNQSTMRVDGPEIVPTGFAPGAVKQPRPCRYCLRTAGLLPALRRKGSGSGREPGLDFDDEGEE